MSKSKDHIANLANKTYNANKRKFDMARKLKISRFDTGSQTVNGRGKYMLFALAVLVLLILGFLVGRTTASKAASKVVVENKTPIGQPGNSSKYGPKNNKGVVPTGYSHSVGGAVTAATTYVGVIPRLYLLADSPFQVSVISMATPDFKQALEDGINKNRVASRDILNADPNAFFRSTPLGYQIISQSDDEVQVKVWTLVMLVAQPNYNGTLQSKMHTLDLKWVNGDWKVDNWITDDGPTPRWISANGLMTVDDFETAISPISGGYDHVPSF
jgi:hypothetical protein